MRRIFKFYQNNHQIFLPSLIFVICIVVYLANNVTLAAGDTVPNSLLALNLLENHTFHLDIFRNSYIYASTPDPVPYFFQESSIQHLTSTYPIGAAIITFPFYLIFYLYLKILNGFNPIDLTSSEFEAYRLLFEKLVATMTTSVSAVLFYLACRLKFKQSISLLSTFIYAFATSSWTTSSQGLWQHGPSNLAVTAVLFLLLKANRVTNNRSLFLLLAGIFCGLLPSIRPTNIVFTIATVIYSIIVYRTQAIFLFVGLISILPSIFWNLYYFGNLVGGYTRMFPTWPYVLAPEQILIRVVGVLFSPSRGLFIFSPIVLYALPGAYQAYKLRFNKDEKLLVCLSLASTALTISYFLYKLWWAGHSYGPRVLTDVMPIACYLINYPLNDRVFRKKSNRKFSSIALLIFLTALSFSTFVQAVGAFGMRENLWNSVPLNVDLHPDRLWHVRDSQIERCTRGLLNKIIKPYTPSAPLSGLIYTIEDENGNNLSSPIGVSPREEVVFKAKLENTGSSKWYGYQYATDIGEVKVRSRLYSEDNQIVKEDRLYVSDIIEPKETVKALGYTTAPGNLGRYNLVFDLVSEGIGEVTSNNGSSVLNLEIIVREENKALTKERHLTPHVVQLEIPKVFAHNIKLSENLKYLKAKSTITVPVVLKNNSNFIWTSQDRNPVNFSYHWLDKNNKVVVFNGDRTPLPLQVFPGKTVALNAIVKAPSIPGEYTLRLTMVQEGIAWFSDRGAEPLDLPVTIEASNALAAQPQPQKMFAQEIKLSDTLNTLTANSTTFLPVILKNTSNFVWSSQGQNPVNFSYQWLDENDRVVVLDGARTPLPFNLEPKKLAAVNAAIATPTKPGKYTLRLTMVQEGVSWFTNAGAQPLDISVNIDDK